MDIACLLALRVRRRPDAPAVVGPGLPLVWRALRERVGRVLRMWTVIMAAAIVTGCTSPPPGPRIVATIPTPGRVQTITVGEGGVWVTLLEGENSYRVLKIDPGRDGVTGSLLIRGPKFAVGESGLWVLDATRGRDVHRFDAGTLDYVATIPVVFASSSVAAGEGAVWVGSAGGIQRIDPRRNRVVATIQTAWPRLLAVGANAVWATDRRKQTVSRVDPQTNEIVAVIPVAGSPGHEPGPPMIGAGFVWIEHRSEGARQTLSRIDPGANRVVGEPFSVAGHIEVAVGGGYLWLASPKVRWYPKGGYTSIARRDPRTLEVVGPPFEITPSILGMVFGFDSLWVLVGPAGSQPSSVHRVAFERGMP